MFISLFINKLSEQKFFCDTEKNIKIIKKVFLFYKNDGTKRLLLKIFY